jgi:hypothetical protein
MVCGNFFFNYFLHNEWIMGDDLLQLATSLFRYFSIHSPNKLMKKNYCRSFQLKLKRKMNGAGLHCCFKHRLLWIIKIKFI